MNWENMDEELKKLGAGTHVMILPKHSSALEATALKAGMWPEYRQEEVAHISKRKPHWKDVMKSVIDFFTPGDDDEIFKWIPPKRGMAVAGPLVDKCEILVSSKDVKPGITSLSIYTLRAKK